MANELGLQGLHIPEEYGGQGFTWVELGIVLEEMGRALLCAPYFSTVVLAADAILNAGTDDQKKALLPGIASGETIATLAFTEPNGQVGRRRASRWRRDGGKLNGTKMFVLDGHTADLIVVVARAAGTTARTASASTPSPATPRGSPAPRSPRWTRPASRPSSSSTASRRSCSAPRATAGRR